MEVGSTSRSVAVNITEVDKVGVADGEGEGIGSGPDRKGTDSKDVTYLGS